MKYVWLILLIFPILSFSQIQKEQIVMISSFPNITTDNKYRVSAGNQILEFSFPVIVAPFTKIRVFGKKYRYLLIVDKKEDVTILSGISFFHNLAGIRNHLTQKIINNSSEAPLILSLILGNKNFLPDTFQYAIRIAGLSHIFALSGLHLAIFLLLFIWLLQFFQLPPRYQVFFLVLPALSYLFLGGMGISLQRSFLFFVICGLSVLTRIPLSLFKVWLLSLVIHLLFSPKIIFTPSFVLSYAAILGIVRSLRWDFSSKYFGVAFGRLVRINLSIFFIITPVIIFYFAYFNIGSIIAGLFILPIIPVIIIICFIALVLVIADVNSIFIDKILEFCYNLIYEVSFLIASKIPTLFFSDQSKITVIILWILILMYTEIRYHIKKGISYVDK
ncbi:MAG: ComEC/Rec2 family competence protein [Brevinema sp.]